jgi:hypothetical protein
MAVPTGTTPPGLIVLTSVAQFDFDPNDPNVPATNFITQHTAWNVRAAEVDLSLLVVPNGFVDVVSPQGGAPNQRRPPDRAKWQSPPGM